MTIVKKILQAVVLGLICANSVYSQGKYPEVSIKNTELRRIDSKIVKDNYSINVFLPRGYYTDTISYPVVFVLDAEYNFGMVSYGTRRLIKQRTIPDVILIGIAYDTTYRWYTNNRQRDYTPTKTRIAHTGGGENFISFIEKELMPFVEGNYRIKDDKTIVGHSLGGSFGYYCLFNQPDLFDRYLLVSPSLWYDDSITFHYEMSYALRHTDLKAKVYSSIGSLETIKDGLNHDMVRDHNRMTTLLQLKPYPSLSIKSEVHENETHRSVFPTAFMKGMEFLFSVHL